MTYWKRSQARRCWWLVPLCCTQWWYAKSPLSLALVHRDLGRSLSKTLACALQCPKSGLPDVDAAFPWKMQFSITIVSTCGKVRTAGIPSLAMNSSWTVHILPTLLPINVQFLMVAVLPAKEIGMRWWLKRKLRLFIRTILAINVQCCISLTALKDTVCDGGGRRGYIYGTVGGRIYVIDRNVCHIDGPWDKVSRQN